MDSAQSVSDCSRTVSSQAHATLWHAAPPASPPASPAGALAAAAAALLAGRTFAKRLYVGSLHYGLTETDLHTAFSPFGAILKIDMPMVRQ